MSAGSFEGAAGCRADKRGAPQEEGCVPLCLKSDNAKPIHQSCACEETIVRRNRQRRHASRSLSIHPQFFQECCFFQGHRLKPARPKRTTTRGGALAVGSFLTDLRLYANARRAGIIVFSKNRKKFQPRVRSIAWSETTTRLRHRRHIRCVPLVEKLLTSLLK